MVMLGLKSSNLRKCDYCMTALETLLVNVGRMCLGVLIKTLDLKL